MSFHRYNPFRIFFRSAEEQEAVQDGRRAFLYGKTTDENPYLGSNTSYEIKLETAWLDGFVAMSEGR